MLRVISWNISCMGGDPFKKLSLLNKLTLEHGERIPAVIALQEVTEKAYEALSHDDLFTLHTYSLRHRRPGYLESSNRGLGCLIATTGGVEISDDGLINRVLFPERALKARIHWQDKQFELISFHSLTGVDFKRAKSAHFAALADYLHDQQKQPMIVCCDLNEPKIDHIDPEKVVTFDQRGDGGRAAALILRPSGVHSLRDTYRLWLNQKMGEKELLRWNQATESGLINNPLAVSYMTGKHGKRRYDHIFVSPHWQVKYIDYLYEEGLQHGSDHAMVLTELEWVD